VAVAAAEFSAVSTTSRNLLLSAGRAPCEVGCLLGGAKIRAKKKRRALSRAPVQAKDQSKSAASGSTRQQTLAPVCVPALT